MCFINNIPVNECDNVLKREIKQATEKDRGDFENTKRRDKEI